MVIHIKSQWPGSWFNRNFMPCYQYKNSHRNPPHLDVVDRCLWWMWNKMSPDKAPPSLESFYLPLGHRCQSTAMHRDMTKLSLVKCVISWSHTPGDRLAQPSAWDRTILQPSYLHSGISDTGRQHIYIESGLSELIFQLGLLSILLAAAATLMSFGYTCWFIGNNYLTWLIVQGPLLLTCFKFNPSTISNHIHYIMWDEMDK